MTNDETRDNWYHLHVHLMNIICECDNLTAGQRHDLFHSHIAFNNLCPTDLRIDWDAFYSPCGVEVE